MGLVMSDFDAAESLRRARLILDNAEREIAAARVVLRENEAHPDRASAAGNLICEYGAMFHDACNGIEPVAKASQTRKIRRALGFTYP